MSYFLTSAVPVEVTHAAQVLKDYAAKNSSTDNWFIYGLGPVQPLKARILLLEAALIHEYHELVGGGDYLGEKRMSARDKIDYMIARVPK